MIPYLPIRILICFQLAIMAFEVLYFSNNVETVILCHYNCIHVQKCHLQNKNIFGPICFIKIFWAFWILLQMIFYFNQLWAAFFVQIFEVSRLVGLWIPKISLYINICIFLVNTLLIKSRSLSCYIHAYDYKLC